MTTHDTDTIPCPHCHGNCNPIAGCDVCGGEGVVAADWVDPNPGDDELTERHIRIDTSGGNE